VSSRQPQTGVAERLRDELERARRILLVRLRSLGDSLLILPLIEALHACRPGLEIDVLVESSFAAVFSANPAVHETLVLKPRKKGARGWSRTRAMLEIRRRRYPVAVNLHGGTTGAILTFASGARFRVGQEGYRSTRAYNAMIPRSSEIWGRSDLHTVEHQLSLLRWLSLPVPENPQGRLHLEAGAVERVASKLRGAGIDRYFVVHPTATLETKQWPEKNFAEVADWLGSEYGLPVILTAGASEGQTLVNVARHTRSSHRYWTDLSLEELFALIAGSRIFVGNDSGPAHAAAALGKPVMVVWGSSNFRAWHPWATEYEAVRSDLPCMPCPGYTCAAFDRPKCILDIPSDRVIGACTSLIARTGKGVRS
jgi:predicted lipopolysaccharide heptosyltransferase III